MIDKKDKLFYEFKKWWDDTKSVNPSKGIYDAITDFAEDKELSNGEAAKFHSFVIANIHKL